MTSSAARRHRRHDVIWCSRRHRRQSTAGAVRRQRSLAWHGDFNSCRTAYMSTGFNRSSVYLCPRNCPSFSRSLHVYMVLPSGCSDFSAGRRVSAGRHVLGARYRSGGRDSWRAREVLDAKGVLAPQGRPNGGGARAPLTQCAGGEAWRGTALAGCLWRTGPRGRHDLVRQTPWRRKGAMGHILRQCTGRPGGIRRTGRLRTSNVPCDP